MFNRILCLCSAEMDPVAVLSDEVPRAKSLEEVIEGLKQLLMQERIRTRKVGTPDAHSCTCHDPTRGRPLAMSSPPPSPPSPPLGALGLTWKRRVADGHVRAGTGRPHRRAAAADELASHSAAGDR